MAVHALSAEALDYYLSSYYFDHTNNKNLVRIGLIGELLLTVASSITDLATGVIVGIAGFVSSNQKLKSFAARELNSSKLLFSRISSCFFKVYRLNNIVKVFGNIESFEVRNNFLITKLISGSLRVYDLSKNEDKLILTVSGVKDYNCSGTWLEINETLFYDLKKPSKKPKKHESQDGLEQACIDNWLMVMSTNGKLQIFDLNGDLDKPIHTYPGVEECDISDDLFILMGKEKTEIYNLRDNPGRPLKTYNFKTESYGCYHNWLVAKKIDNDRLHIYDISKETCSSHNDLGFSTDDFTVLESYVVFLEDKNLFVCHIKNTEQPPYKYSAVNASYNSFDISGDKLAIRKDNIVEVYDLAKKPKVPEQTLNIANVERLRICGEYLVTKIKTSSRLHVTRLS